MQKELELVLSPEEAADENQIRRKAAKVLHIHPEKINVLHFLRRSVDARSSSIKIKLKILVFSGEDFPEGLKIQKKNYPDVSKSKQVIIVGTGPAGLFAALTLIMHGIKPVLIERGRKVQSRKADIALLNRNQSLNLDSNYCFGEGGAGTFSDGKLYTRSTKRGNVNDILRTFIEHGANPEILFDAHPHIGSDKLPAIITAIRNTILNAGGIFHFDTRITGFCIKNQRITGVTDSKGNLYDGTAVILATGHSACDIYELLYHNNIVIEAKPLAMGVRVEHPQTLINEIQYHSPQHSPLLPAATYTLVEQVDGRGVFSFCMCPGGTIVPAATGNQQIVVNGMSNSRRNSPYANSGIVVAVDMPDIAASQFSGPLATLHYQQEAEKHAFEAANNNQVAPAQRLTDFVSGKLSSSLPNTSYHPGVVSMPVHELLPEGISVRLQKAFTLFNRKMKGFLTGEALVVAIESRTSSPVRIPRNEITFEHVQIKNLYPCGEGAGYAGGIVSSAIDGVNCAKAIATKR
ncbi:MAG: NAD(P)/FAD-dependent oxidoreductase [Lentimicrobiaceae bacterium]|nr:NAD(P)/FAD-dependent oxidoreductase [Lentimicrobiaceae bacterium]